MKMNNRNTIVTTTGGEYAVYTWYSASYKEAHWQTMLVDVLNSNSMLCLICTTKKQDALREHKRLVEDPLGYLDDED